jgi:hypothetical protein
MSQVQHHPDDDCARFDIEQELNVLGFDNPLIASDLKVGDTFQDPEQLTWWYEVREVWEDDLARWIHLQLTLLNSDEIAERRRAAAAELLAREQEA